jgi:16S rRNA (uracil1498-N3)-methyltransferase
MNLRILQKLKDCSSEVPSNISLMFAPIKKMRMKILLEKATELLVKDFMPVITDHTNLICHPSTMNSTIIEAVEQSERLSVPHMKNLTKLSNILDTIPDNTIVLVCVERYSREIRPIGVVLDQLDEEYSQGLNIVILVGPEGGFSENDLSCIASCKNVFHVSLCDSILRSETAAIVGIGTVLQWQNRLKFNKKPEFGSFQN